MADEKKVRPTPSVDAHGRTLYEVEVEVTETRTLYLWANSEDEAEKAGEVAADVMDDEAVSTDWGDLSTSARPIAQSEVPEGAKTFVAVPDGKDRFDVLPTAEVRAKEAIEDAERAGLPTPPVVPDTITPDMFQPGAQPA